MIRRNLQTENQSYNYWKVQIHRNKIEWVNTILIIEGKNTFCVSSRKFWLIINDKTTHLVVHSKLKTPDLEGFFIENHY